MKVAIIGAGISGLSCAYLLNQIADIEVFEAGDRLGGHTATVDVELQGQSYAVDTGFIVYNDRTYPNFIRLMSELGVASKPTEMSFSVACEQTGLEYNGSNLKGLFAQKSNLFNLRFLGMLKDIMAFNKKAYNDLQRGSVRADQTLGEYLQAKGYGDWLRDKYLVPMGSAIWSASVDSMLSMSLLFFVRFFANHGLLQLNDRPQWTVIKGGSRSYLAPLTKNFADKIHLSSPVQSIQRQGDAVLLTLKDGSQQIFDQVVLACHSDQALSLLSDASEVEESVLGKMAYQANDVVLHTDTTMLPKQKDAWACWNYRIREENQQRAVLTYNMNMLQGINAPETFCVTLNDSDRIDPNKVIQRFEYSHPVFTTDSVNACERWSDVNGVNRTWFCGAYWANGFHEDGCSSGIRVAKALGADW